MCYLQTAKQNHNMKTANTFLKKVAKFKYLGTIVTNKNCIHKEIKSEFRIFCFISHYIKTIILTSGLYGCETWSLTLREELRLFENRVLRIKEG
jgi:uncharacterized membrane protein YsdA (DUF1294 family)